MEQDKYENRKTNIAQIWKYENEYKENRSADKYELVQLDCSKKANGGDGKRVWSQIWSSDMQRSHWDRVAKCQFFTQRK